MSEYTHVFIRKNDTFIELNCFSRNSGIAQALKYGIAPWEKIRGYMESDIRDICNDVKEQIDKLTDEVAATEAVMHEVGSWNNTVEEKREAIAGYKEELSYLEEELDDARHAYTYFSVLRSIAGNSELSQKWEYGKKEITPVIYFGIECGSDVTVEDIVK